MMIRVKEISIADTARAYEFNKEPLPQHPFNIKGFDYAWILNSREWHQGERVLDVGGAYSSFPSYLTNKFGCETWVVDDFGNDEADPFWRRNRSPQDHIKLHPETKYVVERVGNPEKSSLPLNYFDVVYSVSTLEHIPSAITQAAWQHMAALLKPNGELIHAVDVILPSNGGIKKIIAAAIFDSLPFLFSEKIRVSHYLSTPKNYIRIVSKALSADIHPTEKNLRIKDLCLNPEILYDPIESGWNRISKDGLQDYHFQHVTSLLIHFIKE